MNSNKIHKNQGYKVCLARNCEKEAVYELQIFFARKPGWFCESCKKYFEEEGVLISIVQQIESSKTREDHRENYNKEGELET